MDFGRVFNEMKDSVALLYHTKSPIVNEILRGCIGIFERVFPGRIRGYYLLGSHSNKTAVSASDVDLCPLFKNGFLDEEERERAWQVGWLCDFISPCELQIAPLDERDPHESYTAIFKVVSIPIFGEDIRDQLPLLPLEEYKHEVVFNPIKFFARIRKGEPLIYPLDFPDSQGEYYGYDCRWMKATDGFRGHGMKELVEVVGFAARGIVAQKANTYIKNKSETFQLYNELIKDDWADFLSDLNKICREKWGYRIPEDNSERQKLKAFCQRGLAFENHYLTFLKSYCLTHLRDPHSPHRLDIVGDLRRVIFPDDQPLIHALEELKHSDDQKLKVAALDTVQEIERVISKRS